MYYTETGEPFKLFTLLGIAFIVIGVVLVTVGILLPALKAGKAEGGAVIVIGPIPIVIASSPSTARTLMLLGIVLTVLALLAFLLPPILLRR